VRLAWPGERWVGRSGASLRARRQPVANKWRALPRM